MASPQLTQRTNQAILWPSKRPAARSRAMATSTFRSTAAPIFGVMATF